MKPVLIVITAIFFTACQKEVVYIEKLESKEVVENESITDSFSKKFKIKVPNKKDTNSLFGIAHNHFRRD